MQSSVLTIPLEAYRQSLKEAVRQDISTLVNRAMEMGFKVEMEKGTKVEVTDLEKPLEPGEDPVPSGSLAAWLRPLSTQATSDSSIKEICHLRDTNFQPVDPTTGKTLYWRLEARSYSSGQDCPEIALWFVTGVLERKTPKAAWVNFGDGMRQGKPILRLVYDHAERSYAYTTKEQAVRSFLRRNALHLGHLSQKHYAAMLTRNLVKSSIMTDFLQGQRDNLNEGELVPI